MRDHYIFVRNKHVGTQVLGDELKVRTRIDETFFAGWAELRLAIDDLRVLDVQGEWERSLNEECRLVSPLLRRVVGDVISPGLTKRFDTAIGGPDGCTHMTNMILECCHAAVLARRQAWMAEAMLFGSTPEEFYQEWIRVRPKDLLNSCVAFAEDSPLVRGISKDGRRPTGRTERVDLPNPHPGMLSWSRNKIIGIARPTPDTFLAHGILEDNAHSMAVEITVRLPELEIIAAGGGLQRFPTSICPSAGQAMEHAVGLRIGPGLTAAADEQIAQRGCPHLNNIFLESCHAVIQATLAAEMEDAEAEGLQLSLDQLRRRWLLRYPFLRNKCLAYRDESLLIQRFDLAPAPSSYS
ncbi:MAG: DUF2889 domain-containing protein [Chloroflexi bacterium]|nr:DUF2889 domain-containing protein [Chloroflexota bacterium]